MKQLSQVIRAYSRACEYLLSTEITLNDDEKGLVAYYVKEVSRKFVSAALNEQKRLHNNAIQAGPVHETSRP